MLMARVVGTVVSTQKDPGMIGFKLLVVQNLDLSMNLTNTYTIAVDAVGAGMGEVVIVVQGGSARLTDVTKDRPVDAVIVCIVDSVEVSGKLVYGKEREASAALEMVKSRQVV